MKGLFDKLFGRGKAVALSEAQQQRLDVWKALPSASIKESHYDSRYVVVDVESSGLNTAKDSLISIGAVAVSNGMIDAKDAFEVVLRQDTVSNKENILIHGIGASAQRDGLEPAEGLLLFLEYLGKSPLVAYHTFFDQAMIEKSIKQHLGFKPELYWMDLNYILPELFPERIASHAGLDNWLDSFSIGNIMRHNAVSDSYATAQLLQIVFRKSLLANAETPEALMMIEKNRRWVRERM